MGFFAKFGNTKVYSTKKGLKVATKAAKTSKKKK